MAAMEKIFIETDETRRRRSTGSWNQTTCEVGKAGGLDEQWMRSVALHITNQ